MKTLPEWNRLLKEKVLTEDMIEAALWSYNKRAKNCRDQKRSYNKSRYKYANAVCEKYSEQEAEYYNKKSRILKYAKPVCIHKELLMFEKTRVYDYEKDFGDRLASALLGGRIVWSNSYFHRDYDDYDYDWDAPYDGNYVCFFDEVDFTAPVYQYYLFYIVGNHSFHEPIALSELSNYSDIPLVNIDRIETTGQDISDLCSVQFANKVLSALESGEYSIDMKCLSDECMTGFRSAEQAKQVITLEERKRKDTEDNLHEWFGYWENDVTNQVKDAYFKNLSSLPFEKTDMDLREYSNEITAKVNEFLGSLKITERMKLLYTEVIDFEKLPYDKVKEAKKSAEKIVEEIKNFKNKEICRVKNCQYSFKEFVHETIFVDGRFKPADVCGIMDLVEKYNSMYRDRTELAIAKETIVRDICNETFFEILSQASLVKSEAKKRKKTRESAKK